MLYEINYKPDMRITLVNGNNKLGKGIYSFNLMPGGHPISTKDKGVLTNVIGTCQGCCDGCENFCYAVSDARRYHNTVIPSVGRNTVIMRHNLDDTFSQIKEQLIKKKATTMRYHASGEIESYEYLLKMVELAKELPSVQFYFYTKRFAFIDRYLKENGMFPNNLVCNISEWKNNTKGYNLDGLNKFIYDDGSDPSLEKVVHCPAVNKNGNRTGITCAQCKRCMSGNKGTITAVYDH